VKRGTACIVLVCLCPCVHSSVPRGPAMTAYDSLDPINKKSKSSLYLTGLKIAFDYKALTVVSLFVCEGMSLPVK
jgi:hypothetical protein